MSEFNLEIIERENDVTYEVPQVNFPAYEEYKEKAYAVAEHIFHMDVTEENIKEAKQTLAKSRKLTDRLDRARIDMKKDILRNYTAFERQVKEIIAIIDDADREVRSKVKDLEEEERRKRNTGFPDKHKYHRRLYRHGSEFRLFRPWRLRDNPSWAGSGPGLRGCWVW